MPDALSVPPCKDPKLVSHHADVTVRFYGDTQPHGRSGSVNGLLPRLNDGQVAQNSDDTQNCVWFDGGEGARFVMDLQKPLPVTKVRSYSWHKSNRGPQLFSLWGATGNSMPNANFAKGAGSGWTLLGIVDTAANGEGGAHLSTVSKKSGDSLGSFRWLLWVNDSAEEGTFFTELEVE